MGCVGHGLARDRPWMNPGKKQPTRRALRALCDEIGPDDGIDPRTVARTRLRVHRKLRPAEAQGKSASGRKARQLSRQVAETLDAVLAGDTRDALLRGLRVVSVVPAPDATRLLVTVEPLMPIDPVDKAELRVRLERATGWLRTEVAAAVTRRRAPLLTFHLAVADTAASSG